MTSVTLKNEVGNTVVAVARPQVIDAYPWIELAIFGPESAASMFVTIGEAMALYHVLGQCLQALKFRVRNPSYDDAELINTTMEYKPWPTR